MLQLAANKGKNAREKSSCIFLKTNSTIVEMVFRHPEIIIRELEMVFSHDKGKLGGGNFLKKIGKAGRHFARYCYYLSKITGNRAETRFFQLTTTIKNR